MFYERRMCWIYTNARFYVLVQNYAIPNPTVTWKIFRVVCEIRHIVTAVDSDSATAVDSDSATAVDSDSATAVGIECATVREQL